MQEWLTNDQKINPFNPNHPLDAEDFCADLYRYWSIHFKNEKVTKDKGKEKRRTRETRQTNRIDRRSLVTTTVEAVLAITHCMRAVVALKAASETATEETKAIGTVAPSLDTRTIVMTGGAVI